MLRTLSETRAYHSWPHSPSHHTLRLEPGPTPSGARLPFLVGCQSAATSGKSVAKSLSPGTGRLPEQYGHPIPSALDEILASHSWPRAQTHQALLLEPAVTPDGERAPFFSGCHCAARSGCVVERSLNPASTLFPEQYGHPFARALGRGRRPPPTRLEAVIFGSREGITCPRSY